MPKTIYDLGSIAGEFWANHLKEDKKKEELKSRIATAVEEYLSKEPDGSVILNTEYDFGGLQQFKIRRPLLRILKDLNLSAKNFKNVNIGGKQCSPRIVSVCVDKFSLSFQYLKSIKSPDGGWHSINIMRYLYLSRYYCAELINGVNENMQRSKRFIATTRKNNGYIRIEKLLLQCENQFLQYLNDILPFLDTDIDEEEVKRVEHNKECHRKMLELFDRTFK